MYELEEHDSGDESKPQCSGGAEIDGKYTIQLTENEAFYLNDMFAMLVELRDSDTGEPVENTGRIFRTILGLDRKAGIPVPRSVIEKIAFCLLGFAGIITDSSVRSHVQSSINIPGPGKDFRSSASTYIEVEFEETDLWVLREIAHSGVERDGEKVGKNLTIKIARALHGAAYMERVNSDRLLRQVYPSGLPGSGANVFKEED